MNKSKFMRIALIVLSAMILIGVALTIYMLATADERNIIRIDIGSGETQAVEFNNLCLIPGEECEYTVLLSSKVTDKYDVELAFREKAVNTLNNYAYIRIETNGEVICDRLLATLFESDNIVLPIDLSEKKNDTIKIVYYMPAEVGNEAQNAEAAFELLITASNE